MKPTPKLLGAGLLLTLGIVLLSAFQQNPANPCPTGANLTPVYQIQGNGAQSPLLGQTVTVEGVVTGDFQGRGQLEGFFLQTQTGDENPATSDGIFVFTPRGPEVSAGQLVRVSGTVREFAFGNDTAGTLTQLDQVSDISVCGTGFSVPSVSVSLPVAQASDWERLEGMSVSFPQTLTVTEVFNLGRFGEVSLSSGGRLFHPNNGNNLGQSGQANPLRRILLDDASNGQNPSPIPYLKPDTPLRVGDTVTGLNGIFSYGFGSYRVQPLGAVSFQNTNPRPTAPEAVGGSLRVAGMNVLNYFTTFGSRGASNEAEFRRQQAKIVAAIRGLEADVVGLAEIENNADVALQNLVDALNAELGAGTYAPVKTGKLGTDEITVAFIYKPAKVSPEGSFKTDPDPIHNRPPLAQTFRQTATGGRFTVVANHFKSKGSCPESGDTDQGQGCWNLQRVEQAKKLLRFVETLRQTDPDVLLLGDFNAYALEDPIKTLREGGLENLTLRIPAEKRYSYVFFGESGNLDYAFATSSLSTQITGVTEWHINADEPRVLDYNTEFKPDDRFAPTPFRSSDHDPAVIGLELTPDR